MEKTGALGLTIFAAVVGVCGQAEALTTGPLFALNVSIDSPSGESLGKPQLRIHADEEGTVTIGPNGRTVTLTARVTFGARANCRQVHLLVNQTETQGRGVISKTEASTEVVACEGQLKVLNFSAGPRISFTVSTIAE